MRRPRLMKPEDYKLHWVLPEDTWWLRLWAWAWWTSVEDATTCSLGWGYLFMWLALPIRVFCAGVAGVGHLAESFWQAIPQEPSEPPESPESWIHVDKRLEVGRLVAFTLRARSGIRTPYTWEFAGRIREPEGSTITRNFLCPSVPGKYEVVVRDCDGQEVCRKTVKVFAHPALPIRILEGIASGFAKVSMWFKNPVPSAVVRWGGRAVVTAAILAIISVAVFGAVNVGIVVSHTIPAVYHWVANGFPGTTKVLKEARPVAIGGGIAVIAMIVVFFLIQAGMLVALRNAFALPVARGTKRGTLGFFKMLLIAYRGIKSNTCPRIIIEKSPRTVVEEIEASRGEKVLSGEESRP